ncbi:hypothetical protein [Sphingobacterium suaedae]|uniref:DUF4625 domain-containing protein n=1 Tax=Sphingobacterium suaedae TaxID=1686402 RepID=A0ABW5KEI1_9SPHI
MKKLSLTIFAACVLFLAPSCSKDDPTPEVDQEEVGGATLTFTEVTRIAHGDHFDYEDIENVEPKTVSYTGNPLLPPTGAHLHLDVGKTYRLQLVAKDFAGRETQHTFVERDDIHQAFILGAPEGSLSYAYADKKANGDAVNVGVTGYLTVEKEADSFVFRYVVRHLNAGVKEKITAADWNNTNFTQFTGENDLDLKVEVHLVPVGEDGH